MKRYRIYKKDGDYQEIEAASIEVYTESGTVVLNDADGDPMGAVNLREIIGIVEMK